MDEKQADFGLIGLGVMGAALAANIEEHGYTVAVWNHTTAHTDRFMQRNLGGRFLPARELGELVASLKRPRRLMLMIKAGAPVDSMLEHLRPLLQQGDIVVDGGNSWYRDTQEREQRMREDGIDFVGAGVSGGERGARHGPSIMPGGPERAWKELRPVLEAIAAKTDSGPCVAYIGPDGAGHFVKMVHNGIEYGDMQLIAEAYDLMRRVAGMQAGEIAEVFEAWSQGPLESFLVELTGQVLRRTDPGTGRPLVDLIVDAAGQKGTGRWTMETALQAGIAVPTLTAALEARQISALRSERLRAAEVIAGPEALSRGEREQLVADLGHALLASRICAYAQGMSLIRAVSLEQRWGIQLMQLARIWKAGCIIRAKLLDAIMRAFDQDGELDNLLLDPGLRQTVTGHQDAWRRVVGTAVARGVPCPAMGASLAYFDSYRSAKLPQNLIQAQRDAFGAHTYQRLDRPGDGFIHTEWLD